MSYIKPKLIEPKIAKLITNKIEEKKNKINMQNQMKEIEIIQSNTLPEPFHKKILNYFFNFLKNNYILIIIFLLIITLLSVRYIETKKRKAKMIKLLEQVNEDEDYN
jgi:hypothetical protein